MGMRRVSVTGSTLSGCIEIPSSKSMSHRHLLCAALSEGISTIHKVQTSEDVEATLRAVKVLGAQVVREGTTVHIKGAKIDIKDEKAQIKGETSAHFQRGEKSTQSYHFHCGESGSTLRFTIPIGMLLSGEKRFEGEGGLPKRPLTEYLRNFDQLGMTYDYNKALPLVTSDTLKSGTYRLTGGESSQYLSGLMMALPLLREDSQIVIEGHLESEDYVALTLEVLENHGINIVKTDEKTYSVKGLQSFKPETSTVEGDYSQAAFFIVAGLIGSERVTCSNLKRGSQQADRRILETVEAMGGKIERVEEGVVVHPSKTKGTIIDARQCPDIIPILAVLASVSQGRTEIVNGGRLRIKESDRIKSTVSLLENLGADVWETENGMVIEGKEQLLGGFVEGCGDHRIVMAASVAALRCDHPVVIEGGEAINKSYPKFFADFAQLGGQVHGECTGNRVHGETVGGQSHLEQLGGQGHGKL